MCKHDVSNERYTQYYVKLSLLPVKQIISRTGSTQQSDEWCWRNFEGLCTRVG